MQQKTALLPLETTKPPPPTESPFITRYNQVIECYNKYISSNHPKMEVIIGTPLTNKICYLLNKPLLCFVMLLALLIIPLVNIVILGMLIFYLLYLRRESRKHRRNCERVKNPFEKFYFLPQMCAMMGKHYAYVNLQQSCTNPNIKELEGFVFNTQMKQKMQETIKNTNESLDSNPLSVLIYDQYFFDSFYLFRKEFYKTIILLVVAILCVVTSMTFYGHLVLLK